MQLFSRQRLKPTRINLALQGGGAHGAFTWGVLDRLLEDETIEFGWVSAASAGAVNAVALAAGLVAGGRAAARDKLAEVWHAVHKAGVQDFLRMNPFLFSASRSGSLAQVASMWSPYDFNPLGFDPLRRLLNETIDFRRVKLRSEIELLIAATEVATGHARLFRRRELSVEVVLASACLPTLHHAVEINGVAYWDGGFSANPEIVTLALESPVADTLIVQISPLVKNRLPTGAREIQGHMSRLTFNAPLLRQVELIETVREASKRGLTARRGRLAPLMTHRFHLIDAGRHTGTLSDDSKMKPDLDMLTYLFTAGRAETEKWLARHRSSLGRASSIDLKTHYFERPREIVTRSEAPGAGEKAAASAPPLDEKQAANANAALPAERAK